MRITEGFRHNDLIVYAVQYELDTCPPSSLIVWLDECGNSLRPWIRPSESHRRMATGKAGDVILDQGEEMRLQTSKCTVKSNGVTGREVAS